MKRKLNLHGTILGLFTLALLFMLNPTLLAQEKESPELEEFTIVLAKTNSGVKMQGLRGTAWTDLSFTLKNDLPQAVNQYGMTTLDKVAAEQDPALADFLFTITRTNRGFELKGLAGTAWTELKFTLADNKTLAINQYGMVQRH